MYTRLRDLREDNDISQAECAKIGYISKNSYIRYENGERNPPLDVIVTYAKFYNVSIDYIAGLTNDKRGRGYKEQSNGKYNITQKNSPKAVIKIKEEK
ncbi:helix-turn-helix domain-containing protein [uncultured Ruminococcus sp.]|uniref:helix-turn-helix domain-containing protein n=1 Tax=Ruminococcus sp. TaxID=41978 RepID=UPI0026720034|nr:helix-turn-helix transcriptional regulator [uncultured Ruminococcus sp.]